MKRWAIEKYNPVANKVLLFVRLENAVRPGTILKIAKHRKQLATLPASCCAFRFAEHMRVKEIADYDRFYENWPIVPSIVSGDRDALAQITQDFVENCYDDGVAYAEVRFSPHLLATAPNSKLSPAEVTSIILDKLRKIGEERGVYCNALLCCLRQCPEQAREVLDLVRKFRDDGAVGIALAGNEAHFFRDCQTSPEIVDTFREAAYFGINRTVEAGGISPPKAVWEALQDMAAERVGYGYRIVEDPKLYDYVYTGNYHIETSIVSSRLTNAVCTQWIKHPVLQFLHDGISFSINNDMPLLTGTNLCDEYYASRRDLHIVCPEFYTLNKKAAKAAFINYHDREDLLLHLAAANDRLYPEEAKLPPRWRSYEQYICAICLKMVDESRPTRASSEAVYQPRTYAHDAEVKFDCLHMIRPNSDEKYR